MKRASKLTYALAVIFAAALLLITSIVGGAVCRAATSAFSNSDVLKDLQKDENFNPLDYSDNANDYSIKVIQVAESKERELFIYTYQPCQKTNYLIATTVRLSTTTGDEAQWRDYGLTFLNANGVLCKYKVDELTVKRDTVRYYDIAAIHRQWNASFDKDLPIYSDNTINEAAFEVGQLWTVETENGNVSYKMLTSDVVTITEKTVGFVRYPDGYKFRPKSCTDCHYVAFSCDYSIDKLLEADVTFMYCNVALNALRGEPQRGYAFLKAEQMGENSGDGLGGKKRTFPRIEKVSDFIANEDLTVSAVTSLFGKQWVLRFFETDYEKKDYLADISNYTEVTEVTILRLKFETNGVTYNLGVVDNKQSGDTNPDNPTKGGSGCNVGGGCSSLSWGLLIAFVGVLLLLFILRPILSAICPAVGAVLEAITRGIIKFVMSLLKLLLLGVKYLFIGLWWVISLPFRLIAKAIKSRKDKPKSEGNTKTKKTKKAGKKK
ncbi:MAG: hypothetical protein K2O41_00510 [Clostridia bacterium]|nr:hypothetical protein [Clostridia bacterium]